MESLNFLKNIGGKKVLLIGDAVVDKYIIGTTTRVTPESPVPIVDIQENNNFLGQLGILSKFVLNFGGIPIPCTILGNDFEGQFFLEEIKKLKIKTDGILQENLATPQITRIKSWGQHVVHLEKQYDIPLSLKSQINQKILEFVEMILKNKEVDIILLLDYNLGLYYQNYLLINNLLNLGKDFGIKIISRPDKINYHFFTKSTLLKMNLNSAASILGINQLNETSIRIIANKIMNDTQSEAIYLTSLHDDSIYFAGDKLLLIPKLLSRPPISNAGTDSAQLSILALLVAANAPLELAVKLANFAGALEMTKPNVTYFSLEELIEVYQSGQFKCD